RNIRGHARLVFLDVEGFTALATGVLPVLDAERLHRHHWAGHDGGAVAAARHLTRAVLGPEGVDDFRAFVLVVLALIQRNGERIKIRRHHLVGGQVSPGTLLSLRTVAVVIRHDLRLDFGLDVGEEPLYFLQIDIRELLLDHEPRDRVEVIADHLHAQARTRHQRGSATHEDIPYLQALERALLP